MADVPLNIVIDPAPALRARDQVAQGIDDLAAKSERAGERIGDSLAKGLGGGGGSTRGKPGKPATDALLRQIDSLSRLENTLNPVIAAQRQLASTERELQDAEAAGLVSREESVELLERQRVALQSQLAPLEAVAKDLQQEIALTKLDAVARKNLTDALRVEEDLRRRGVAVTDQQRQQLRDLIATRNREVAATERAASATGGLASLAKTAFIGIGASLAARRVVELADAFTNLQNRLRVVTTTQAELGTVTERVFQIAQRTRQDVSATAEVFTRVSQAARDLGISQEQALRFTERLNKAVILSGASASEAQAGLIQLSQGLASGALRGDELRSVLEQLPVVADIIGKKLGVTRGQLRELGSEGKLTADLILAAFDEAGGGIDAAFGKTVPTISQTFAQLRNDLVKVIGESADDITSLVRSLVSVGQALLPIVGLVGKIAEGLALILGNAEALRRATQGPEFSTTTNAERLRTEVASLESQRRRQIRRGDQRRQRALEQQLASTRARLKAEEDILALRAEAQRQAKAAADLARAQVDATRESATILKAAIADIAGTTAKLASGAAAGIVRGANFATFLAGYQAETDALKLSDQERAKRTELLKLEAQLGKDGIEVTRGEAAALGFVVEQRLRLKRALDDEKEAREDALREREQRASSLRSLESSLNPILAAERELAEVEDLLTKSVADGNVTRERANDLLAAKRQELESSLNPFADFVRQYREESELLKLTERERAARIEQLRIERDLETRGVEVNRVGAAVIRFLVDQRRKLIETQREAERAADAERRASERAVAQQQRSIEEIADINREISKLQKESGLGTLAEFFDNTAGSIEQSIADAMLLSARAVAQFATSGELSFKSFGKAAAGIFASLVDSILADLTRLLAHRILVALIDAATGGGGSTGNALTSTAQGLIKAGGGSVPGAAAGGSFRVGGTGGTDSQFLALRVSPNERVDVLTPTQQAAQATAAAPPQAPPNVNVIVVSDAREAQRYLQSPAGARDVVRVVQANRDQIRRLL